MSERGNLYTATDYLTCKWHKILIQNKERTQKGKLIYHGMMTPLH